MKNAQLTKNTSKNPPKQPPVAPEPPPHNLVQNAVNELTVKVAYPKARTNQRNFTFKQPWEKIRPEIEDVINRTWWGGAKAMALDYITQVKEITKIHLAYYPLDIGVYQVLNNPIVKKFIEILSIESYPAKDLSRYVGELIEGFLIPPNIIEQYNYFYWHIPPGYKEILLTYLKSSNELIKFYGGHLKLLNSPYNPYELAIMLDFPIPPEMLAKLEYQGLCRGTVLRNQALKTEQFDDAETLVKHNSTSINNLEAYGFPLKTSRKRQLPEIIEEEDDE